jgi:hypothetical protein
MWQKLRQAAPRWLALVVIGAVALGSYLIAPAIGGPPKLTTTKAKQLFYTKNQSNARYYLKSVSDARFLSRQLGEWGVTLDTRDWNSSGAIKDATILGQARFLDSSGEDEITLRAENLPREIAGKELRLSAVEVCFELTHATLTELEVTRTGPTSADPVPSLPITFLDDTTPLTSDECHRFSAPPAPVGGASAIQVTATVSFSGGGEIDIGRTTALFVP